MSSTITFNGVSYSVPATGDENWSDSLTLYLIAIASGALQKTGGTFTLTAETDFGATYGIKSTYYKSRATNPSSTGIVRLGNTESISWRNAANSADYALKVNASNILEYNGNAVLDAASSALNLLITNAMVSNSAAIAYSKLNLGTSIVNADISASAAIAYSKLNLGTSIVNADISTSAAIAMSKLAALTTGKVLQSNASTGAIEASSVSTTTLGYLDATSSVQTQLDAKSPIASPTFTGTATVAQLIDSGLTANTVPYANASKQLTSSAVTPTELGYVSGVTSAIQTQINAISATTVPSGQISMYGGSSAPSGYLLCDGSAVSRTTYAALFTAISTTFGVGDGSTTFNVPDIRGIFVRGAGTHGTLTNANGTAFSGTLGTQQNDKMQGHAHSGNFPQVNGSHVNDAGTGTLYGTGSTNSASIGNPSADGANGTPRTGTETNPANISLTYIIKT